MTQTDSTVRLLLISNSTTFGSGYLDHVEDEIRGLLGNAKQLVFIPFALHDREAYTEKAQKRFSSIGFQLRSVHNFSNMQRAIHQADAIFVGGGNTFRLLKELYDHDLLSSIRERVMAGTPYIGASAGSIVACPALKTTKDMPIVQPPSFEALHLVPFQISPHYLDPDPSSRHMGETQEERIFQFLEENDDPVVGLREGSYLRIQNGSVVLKGPNTARIFRCGQETVEVTPGSDLSELLYEKKNHVPGRVA